MYRIAVCDDNRALLEAAAERLRIWRRDSAVAF